MKRPKLRVPHVFVLLLGAILLCSLASYVVPSGRYERRVRVIEGRERTLLVPGTYERLPKHISLRGILLGGQPPPGQAAPVGLRGFLTAVPRGLEAAADIVFFILVIGGVFGILQRTGVIMAGIGRLLHLVGGSATLLTIVLMTVIAVGGSTLGMGEEFIPLVPLFLLVSDRLGYDRIYGMALVILAADVGFAASTTNPFTVAVAQGIAQLPLQSGLGLRIVFLAVTITVTIAYLLRYGARLRRDPASGLLAGEAAHEPVEAAGGAPATVAAPGGAVDGADAPAGGGPGADLSPDAYGHHHTAILTVCAAVFALIIYGVQAFGWWMSDMAGGFLLMGLAAAVLARLSVDETSSAFVEGMREMMVAGIVVGFARGIAVVLSDGAIIDTVIHGAATLLGEVPRHVAVLGMLGFESCLNLLIPSGSGQAAVSMPLMAPLADVLGITRQTAVFAFTCGDGFSNLVIPTSGILMAMLSLARIPYGTWLRFMLPLFGILLLLSAGFLMLAVAIGYS